MKGEEVASTLKTDEYVQLGIKTEPFSLAGLLRYLSFKYGEKLWATNQELFNEIGGNIELSLFFQTEEWEHPDISDDQKPSEVVFFRSLAQAIERNNVDLIQLNTSNTHWSNWTGSDFEN
ncbi:TPA: hypothetical protein ROX88_000240 [Bacillus pseudomycoides]|nr:hypothetical protein [Bacillus pseudomycoides]